MSRRRVVFWFYLESGAHRRVRELSSQRGITMAQFVRESLAKSGVRENANNIGVNARRERRAK